jgi:hypothetical protein
MWKHPLMDLTSPDHLLKSLEEKKDITRLKKFSKNDQPETRKAHNIWSNGKDTPTLRIPGYQPKN